MNDLLMKQSSFAQEKVFSDTFSTTALALCQSFDSVDELAYMDLAQRSSFLQEIGKNRFTHPEEAAKSDKYPIFDLENVNVPLCCIYFFNGPLLFHLPFFLQTVKMR